MIGLLCMGEDLGRVRDNSCLAVLEAYREWWYLIYLKTFRPTRDDMVDALQVPVDFLDRHRPSVRARLAIDGCGKGKPVAEAAIVSPRLTSNCDVFPILPSHSDLPHRQRKEDLYTWVGKDPLVELLATLLETKILRFAAGLAEKDEILHEFAGLEQIPTRRGTRRTWSHRNQRKNSHDDRVFALAYAAWLAWNTRPGLPVLLPANRRAA